MVDEWIRRRGTNSNSMFSGDTASKLLDGMTQFWFYQTINSRKILANGKTKEFSMTQGNSFTVLNCCWAMVACTLVEAKLMATKAVTQKIKLSPQDLPNSMIPGPNACIDKSGCFTCSVYKGLLHIMRYGVLYEDDCPYTASKTKDVPYVEVFPNNQFPENFSKWQDKGIFNDPRPQLHCNCCWAMVACTLVKAKLMATKAVTQKIKLSPQDLLNSMTPRPNACIDRSGCFTDSVYKGLLHIKRYGVLYEDDCPYTASKTKDVPYVEVPDENQRGFGIDRIKVDNVQSIAESQDNDQFTKHDDEVTKVANDKAKELVLNLKSVTLLYNEYVVPFQLWEAIRLEGDVCKKEDAAKHFRKLDILVNGAAGNFL